MAHLYVIPARDKPLAIILRRGPSAWYHLILWETRRDTFTGGAWFKGRIYEERCDLSPDGQLFIYFAHQERRFGTASTHAWTAISRPPWLHALALWPNGTTYGGGGKFTAARTVWGVSSTNDPDFPRMVPLRFAERPPEPREAGPVLPEADWTGYDHNGNVVFTQGHRLFRRLKRQDILIADFSALTPDPQPAPEWATRPP